MTVEVGTGCPTEFAASFADVYPRARAVALRILGSVPDAEDAAAEALARALADWTRVGSLPHCDAWILRVTANVAIDVVRRRRADTAHNGHADVIDDIAVLRVTLAAALGALPRRQAEAVVLRHMAGLPEQAVADALGVSHNTAKKHLQRGMARLRAALASEEGVSLGID